LIRLDATYILAMAGVRRLLQERGPMSDTRIKELVDELASGQLDVDEFLGALDQQVTAPRDDAEDPASGARERLAMARRKLRSI
jgi:hypothetical protein